MEIAELIRRRRKELHMSQQQLADEVGVSRAEIGQWESGITGPTRRNAPKLAKALQLELSALSHFLAQPVSEVDTSSEGRHVPVMGWADFINNARVSGTTPRIWVGSEVPNDAVALRVPDDALAPEYNPGDVIIVSRAETPNKGDAVVAYLDGRGLLRKYEPRGRDRTGTFVFDLLSTSPDWPTITCNSHNPGNILAVVVGHWRAVRR
jgi:SOS-response transcriptional repressor LexA